MERNESLPQSVEALANPMGSLKDEMGGDVAVSVTLLLLGETLLWYKYKKKKKTKTKTRRKQGVFQKYTHTQTHAMKTPSLRFLFSSQHSRGELPAGLWPVQRAVTRIPFSTLSFFFLLFFSLFLYYSSRLRLDW